MPAPDLRVVVIGEIARQALAQPQPASLMGTTSRGLFLRLASGWVIFLSFEPTRGPLTLNLASHPAALTGLETGATVHCSPVKISLPFLPLSLPLADAKIWQPPAPPAGMLPPEALRLQLREVARLAAQHQNAGPLPRLLPALVAGQPPADPPDQEFYPRLVSLQAACRQSQTQAVAAALEGFLGLGPGLTPTGDDLALGFLLALNRWGGRLSIPLEIAWLNREVPARARGLTGDLSASLIACAAQGQANQRLVEALDGIVTGSLPPEACVTTLAGWGSSSGLDALAGMALALNDFLPP